MNKHFLSLLLLAATVSATAQTKDKTESKNDSRPKHKSESITIRTNPDKKEKTTIVIDGENVTVNGKPIDELKDDDIEVLRDKSMGRIMAIPRLRSLGGAKMFDDGFPFSGNKAFLGVTSDKADNGVKISSVEKESAAEKAGLKKDDIINKVGDTKIETSSDLYDAIGKYKPEDKVAISYTRDGKAATATATLGKNDSPNIGGRVFKMNGDDFKRNFDFNFDNVPGVRDFAFNMRRPRLGIEVQDVEEGKGIKVLDVDSDTPASKAGLQKDDVITEIDGKAISSVDDLRSKTRELKEGDSLKITFQRSGKTQTAEVKFPKKLKTADL